METEVLRWSGIERGPPRLEAGDEQPELWRGLWRRNVKQGLYRSALIRGKVLLCSKVPQTSFILLSDKSSAEVGGVRGSGGMSG